MKKIEPGATETRTTDVVAENIAKLKALFPEIVTEGPKGTAVNVDAHKGFVGDGTVTDTEEKYGLNWHGKRRYVLVQLPEPLDPENSGQKVAADFCDKLRKPRNIAELRKERLRRAAKKIKEENPKFAGDLGFRVFNLDSTNIQEWDPKRENLEASLLTAVEHLKSNRSEADILYELLLKLGIANVRSL